MATYTKERYSPKVIGINQTVRLTCQDVGLFACMSSGNITLTGTDDNQVTVPILDTFPVEAGVIYPLCFFIGVNGGVFVAAGGASGTLGV